ncbi:response regulator [Sorangium sp. So ce131]|uniref:response regulator transcription factor n=1 Tax=Sorangium sp. So ce131 TaxID=3133282 RepID=UPI003F620046
MLPPPRVLVAEDEPAMLSLVARHLRNLGFSVIEASEGDAAWDLANEHRPDLVILDVMMPGMSGWEICKRLKSDTSDGRPFASTGVIMLTGIGENLNEMTSPLFAADAWLNKPFDFADLDERVRETLARYAKPLPGSNGSKGQASLEDEGGDDVEEVESEPPPRPTQASGGRATAGKRSTANGAPAATKKTAAKPAASKRGATKKPASKKTAAKPAASKKGAAPAASKKTAAKSTASKKGAAPAASKKAAANPAASKKAAAKPASKKGAAPAASKKTAAKPAASKKTAAKKAAPKKKTAK